MTKIKTITPLQGEGDKTSARHYNAKARSFVASDKVAEAATTARAFVDANPVAAARDEATAKAGPHPVANRFEELMAEGRAMVIRARLKLRAKLAQKPADKSAT